MKLGIFICILITFFNFVTKSDFFSMLVYVLIFTVLNTTYKSDPYYNIKICIFSLLFSIVFDVIWICLNFNVNLHTNELKKMKYIVFLNTNIIVFLKIFLMLICFIEKEKINNIETKQYRINSIE